MTSVRRLGPARDPGADFDPHALGERLRRLRTEQGMTLGQVAGDRFSAAFLSQVERGLARPSAANLRHISERLSVDLDDLLAAIPREVDREVAQLRLTEARTALAREEPTDALAALEGLPTPLTEADALEADLCAADALIRLERYDEGLERIEAALPRADLAGAEQRVRAAEIACRAHYRRQRYHLALEALRAAQEVLDEPAVDPMTRSRFLTDRGMCQFVLGNERAAVADYEAALEASGNVTDLAELGRIYDALNLAHQALGNLGEALTYARRSTQIFEVLQSGRHVGRTHHNMGDLLLKQGALDEAEAAFRRALAAFRAVDAVGPQAYALHSLATVALERGDLEAAGGLAADAAATADRGDDDVTRGDVAQLRGQVALRRGDLDAAEEHLTTAVALFESTGVARRLADACFLLGSVLQCKGEDSRALTYALRSYSAAQPDIRREPS